MSHSFFLLPQAMSFPSSTAAIVEDSRFPRLRPCDIRRGKR
jgi:hypothetical protein